MTREFPVAPQDMDLPKSQGEGVLLYLHPDMTSSGMHQIPHGHMGAYPKAMRTAWIGACSALEPYHVRLTSEALSREVMRHSVQREYVAHFRAYRHDVASLRARISSQEHVLKRLVVVLARTAESGLFGEPDLWSAIRDEISRNVLGDDFEPTSASEFITHHNLSSTIDQLSRLAREVLGTTASVEAFLRGPAADTRAQLVVEVRYNRASIGRAAERTFMKRYSEDVAPDIQELITLFRVPA